METKMKAVKDLSMNKVTQQTDEVDGPAAERSTGKTSRGRGRLSSTNTSTNGS